MTINVSKIFYKMMTKSSFGSDDEPPFYSVDKLAKFADASYVFYGLGIPRNEDYSPYKLDNLKGLVALYKIDYSKTENTVT